MRTLMWQHQYRWLTAASILVCLVSLACRPVATSAASCGPGIDTPGVTYPRGDIIIEHGNPLEILCVLNASHPKAAGKSAYDLEFVHDNTQVPAALVTVLNATTIRLNVEKPPPSKSMYYCRLVTNATATTKATAEGVCLNSVAIAFKPQEVLDFSCISHNWENLTCTWKKPENHVKTLYTLWYRLPGRAGGRSLYGCPNNTDLKESRCFWDMTTDPHYRQPYEYYYFTMSGENMLGNVTFQSIKFHHYSHVIPTSPSNLSLVNRTTNGVNLEWKIPFPMQIFPPGVIHKLRFQSEWDGRDEWEEVALNLSTKVAQTNGRHVNLTGLKYANALYDIKVFIKSAAATMGPDMWSFPANLTVKTAPTVPGSAPTTDMGSFEVSGGASRDVYVYWKHIPESLKNGENFEYKVYRLLYGHQELMEPIETTKAYSKFKDIGQLGYRLMVVSANKEGRSHNHSSIFIPGPHEAPPEPLSFTKIAFGNGVYELSWRPAVSSRHPTDNYTIFWCDNDRDRPYQCTGYLDWLHIPGNMTVTRMDVSEQKIFQFAISANSRSGSSGMVWASCTVIHDKIVGKMKNVWINTIGSRFIEVGWKLDCSDRAGMVSGFRISYCPIVGPQQIVCKEPLKNMTVPGDPSTSHGKVEGLRPYTTYMVAVAVLTKSGGGQLSLPLLNTTWEAEPDSPPQNVTFSEVTNSSLLVSWQPPAVTNGLLRYYEVNVNDRVSIVEQDKTSLAHVRLTDLDSYKNYTVSVAACTVSCSRPSVKVTMRTGVGAPSVVDRPIVKFLNSSEVVVSWRPPWSPGGALDRYELLVQQRDRATNISTLRYVSEGLETQVPVADCKGEGASMTYSFLVRAVNLGADNITFPGAWSEPGETNCYTGGTARNTLVIIWVITFIVVISICAFFGYMGKRVWQRCKVMQDVEVKLPPGLAPIGEKDSGKIHVQSSFGVDSRDDSREPHRQHSASGDEELLLHKTERHDRNPSGGSSGCSSGHESVSSSRTSGTHMSSDSGTEQDQRPASPDGVFSEPPSWECASLGGACVDGSYVRMGKLPHAPGPDSPVGSVPDLGPPGPLATWHSTGYISMPSSEELSAEGEGEGDGDGEADVGGLGADREGVGYCRVGLEPAKGYVSIASISRPAPVPAPGPGPGRKGEAYCRMGLQAPLAPAAATQGYVALPDSRPGGLPAATGYVPHARFDKKEEMLATVFAPGACTEPRSRIGSPTANV